jgi:glycolate dehydrogenase FAD-linked subunit
MEIAGALEKIVGPERVSTSEAVCQCYQFNCFTGKDWLQKPEIVVLAENPQEVSEILKAANRYKVPVTPKGGAGGGGLGGPLRGGILLDLSHMERIVALDVENMKVVAEAGCSFFKLSQELFKKGLMLPIGGYGCGPNVAASAIDPSNGFGKTRYGPNIDLVEGFEVVLPSGEIIEVGSLAYANSDFGPYYRYITGPDLVGLFTRSNGAFGIVTKVAFYCLRKPQHWSFLAYCWPSHKITEVTRVLMEATAEEIFDVHLNDKWRFTLDGPRPFPEDCYFIVMFTVNSDDEEELRVKERAVEKLSGTYGGKCLPGIVEEHYLNWPTRFAGWARPQAELSPPPLRVGRPYTFIMGELIYPTSRLPEIYQQTREVCQKYGIWNSIPPPVFDGYPMKRQVMSSQTWVFTDSGDPGKVEQYHRCQAEFQDWFGKKGGTYQMKLPPLVPGRCWTNQPGDFGLLKSIKKLLDPNNILSPGTFEIGEEAR